MLYKEFIYDIIEGINPKTLLKRSYPAVYYFKRLGFVAIALLIKGEDMIGV